MFVEYLLVEYKWVEMKCSAAHKLLSTSTTTWLRFPYVHRHKKGKFLSLINDPFTSTKEVIFLYIGLSEWLLITSLKKLWTDFDEIFRIALQWTRNYRLNFGGDQDHHDDCPSEIQPLLKLWVAILIAFSG